MKIGVRSSKEQRAMRGFTIVETMVVLAVTGALFVVIAVTLGGRQNAAEFTHAIQSAQSQIQQIIGQVSDGFYPNQNFSCSVSGTGLIFASGGNQGVNQDCVFLGKVIQFAVSGTGGGTPEQYRVYTIAGQRLATAGAASPFAPNVTPTVVNVGSDYVDYSDVHSFEYGLHTLWIKTNGAPMGSVGFLMEPGSLSGATGSYSSGAQQVDLIPLTGGTTLGQTITAATTAINLRLNDTTLTADAPINPPAGVQICLVSGGTNQSGLISIGGSGRQLRVQLNIMSNQTCS